MPDPIPDRFTSEFGPASEADITRMPDPGDKPVRHAHETDDDEWRLLTVHEHPGGRDDHWHDWLSP